MTNLEDYGQPVIQLQGLRIWVHGYQFPDATDYWDGNWLMITAHCAGSGSNVMVTGAVLDTVSFLRFGRELADFQKQLQGSATLNSHEPELKVEVRAMGSGGHVEVDVEITADQLNESHRFRLTLDQSYLPPVVRGCEQVLERFPVRNAEGRGV